MAGRRGGAATRSGTCRSRSRWTPRPRCAPATWSALGIDGHRWGLRRRTAEQRRRIADALEAVGATGYADAPIGLLSGGEQQRVRIAQALATDPSLLLCDEPLLSLDLRHQRAVADMIDRRRREHDTAVVFVTHEINPVLDLVDRVLYIAAGGHRIGPPVEVLTSADAQRPVPDAGRRAERPRPGGRGRDAGRARRRRLLAPRPHPGGRRPGARRCRLMDRLFDFTDYGALLGLVHNSLIAAALLGVVGGLVGVFVQVRDMQFAVHGISELSFAGGRRGAPAGRQRRARLGARLGAGRGADRRGSGCAPATATR